MAWLRTLLCVVLLGAVCGLGAQETAPNAYRPAWGRVDIPPVKTSIYIGSVTLTMTPLLRQGDGYDCTYAAKVFPFFFENENGKLRIDMSHEQLAKLERGETIQFTGHAENNDGEPRRVEGRAVPTDGTSGNIKVRVFISKKIELIFNTTYRFSGKS